MAGKIRLNETDMRRFIVACRIAKKLGYYNGLNKVTLRRVIGMYLEMKILHNIKP